MNAFISFILLTDNQNPTEDGQGTTCKCTLHLNNNPRMKYLLQTLSLILVPHVDGKKCSNKLN